MLSNKKGISAIVATLLIILLAIIAFSIVSVVVKNTVTEGVESTELAIKCLDVEIHAFSISEVGSDLGAAVQGYFNVGLERSAAGDPVDGVNIVINDAAGEESFSTGDKPGEIGKLYKKAQEYYFEDSPPGFAVVSVTVVPYFNTDAGKPYSCQPQTDELTLELVDLDSDDDDDLL